MKKHVVLVVEDEALIRMDAAQTIEDAGYVALEAANADEALRILDSRKDVEVVFTDINMPGSMDGLKMARTIHDRWPPIRLIVTSGKIVMRARDIPADRFLPKPYAGCELTAALQALAA